MDLFSEEIVAVFMGDFFGPSHDMDHHSRQDRHFTGKSFAVLQEILFLTGQARNSG